MFFCGMSCHSFIRNVLKGKDTLFFFLNSRKNGTSIVVCVRPGVVSRRARKHVISRVVTSNYGRGEWTRKRTATDTQWTRARVFFPCFIVSIISSGYFKRGTSPAARACDPRHDISGGTSPARFSFPAARALVSFPALVIPARLKFQGRQGRGGTSPPADGGARAFLPPGFNDVPRL